MKNMSIFFSLFIGVILSPRSIHCMEATEAKDASITLDNGHFSISFGIASKKSHRHANEDRVIIESLCAYFDPDKQYATDTFFGVFDGHGRKKIVPNDAVSQYLASHLPIMLVASLTSSKNLDNVPQMIENCIMLADNYTKIIPHQGSTAVFGLLLNNHLLISNTGDSRAVIARDDTDNPKLFQTKDHKPGDPDELARIKAAHGIVIDTQGCLRLGGCIATSRSIGDHPKMEGLICTPSITEFIIDPSFKFIIIATDGLWDVVSSDAAITSVNKLLAEGKSSAQQIAERIVAKASLLGSRDDISVIIAIFAWDMKAQINNTTSKK